MSRTGWALVTVFGLAFIAAVATGGAFINSARWQDAAVAYAVAGLFLTGLLRETGRTLPGDYTDDIEEHPEMVGDAYTLPRCRPLGRRRAARTARRELRRQLCGCDRNWTSAGTGHDEWCPQYAWSSR
ncbi:hypothetical protein [Streptomyces parvulus]|uniref:hypothetical protein n=1 Tax=Streptomyces parvulus TaxID=146923 RepID=UPI003828B2C6